MDMKLSSILASILTLVSITLAVKLLNWVWFRPKKLEKLLRKQGLNGKPYTLLLGDTQDIIKVIKTEQPKTLKLSDDLLPHILPYYHNIIDKYGKHSFFWFGPSPRVNVADPELIKEILSKPGLFHKPRPDLIGETIARGLPFLEDDRWAKRRKIINQAFHMEKLKSMIPAMFLSCSKMIEKWEALISGSGSSQEIDVWPYLQDLTGDVISRTAFGRSYEEGRRIFELQREQVKLVLHLLRFSFIPGWRYFPTKTNRMMRSIAKEIQFLLRGIISQREQAMERGEIIHSDLLSILMESNSRQIQQHGNKNAGLSIEDVIEECKLFYFAGSESTSTLLVWTMVLLSKHQDWQARAREEVLQVFGKKQPTFDGLHQLKISMIPAMFLSCSKMIEKWEASISGSRSSQEIDVWPYLQDLTGDVISRTAFGRSYEEGRRIFELQREQVKLVLHLLRFSFIPGWRYFPTKENRKLRAFAKEIQSLVRGIINQREQAMARGEIIHKDLLGILMESNTREIQHGNKNAGLSIEDVIEECKLFYFAGSETTSTLLVWTMVLLSKHQEWQARAREEVLQIFGKKQPTFDGLHQLKIRQGMHLKHTKAMNSFVVTKNLGQDPEWAKHAAITMTCKSPGITTLDMQVTMIFQEVMRLYPPAPLIIRAPTKTVKLGNTIIPVGVQLMLLIGLLHHDPKIWGDDAKEFKPERFSEGISSATKTQYSFIPFSAGPRVCIGQNFAMIEAKMAVAMILQHFSFELSSSYLHAPFPITTLQPQYGTPLIVRKL
ncbi:UNVERIFIED_CONTAM: cytochrome [Sesamum radiatum]|uniref:Cytochrome n=1 Tax=Sesamum radiatum TaxID=300843 RepID=A0AAW2LNA7_SESRA